MPSTKYEGLSYPTHFLKSRGSVIRNNLFEYRTKLATLFERRNNAYAFLLQMKQKLYSIFMFRAPVVAQFIVKV